MLDKSYLDSVREVSKQARKLLKLEERILYGGNISVSKRRTTNRRAGKESGGEVSTSSKDQLPES